MTLYGYDYTGLVTLIETVMFTIPLSIVTVYVSYKAGIIIENLLTINRKGE